MPYTMPTLVTAELKAAEIIATDPMFAGASVTDLATWLNLAVNSAPVAPVAEWTCPANCDCDACVWDLSVED